MGIGCGQGFVKSAVTGQVLSHAGALVFTLPLARPSTCAVFAACRSSRLLTSS